MVAPVGVGPQGISSGDARRSGPGFVIEWAKQRRRPDRPRRSDGVCLANYARPISATDIDATDLQRLRSGARALVGADLVGADLADADLTGADLSRAVLTGTNFDGAKHDYHAPKPPSLGNPPPRSTAGKVLKPKGNVGPLAPATPTWEG